MKVIKLLLTTILLAYYSHFVQASDDKMLCQKGNNTCTFVLLSELKKTSKGNKPNITSINEERANAPLSPFSTFKVANSLIALDLGVINNVKDTLTYDKAVYPEQPWWPPVWKLPHYDLNTAFKYSMVAIYRQLANTIGEKDMQGYLQKMDYGNQNISSGLDSFWLDGSMKISAVEQVALLKKIYFNEYDFTEKAVDNLKSIMLVETTSSYRLFAKTGAGKTSTDVMLGWYIGFVENASGVHFFAFNFDNPNYAEMKAKRTKVAKNHLKQAGIIE